MGKLGHLRLLAPMVLLAAAVATFGQSAATPSDQIRAALQKWLEEAWADGFKPIQLAGYRWEFEVESRTIVKPAELERQRAELATLRANIQGKPDHPDRMKIIGMEAGDTIEPRVTRYAL